MRNLRHVRFGRWSHPHVTSACWDPEKDEVVCTIGPTADTSTIELVRVSENDITSYKSVATWDAPSPSPDLPVDKIVNIQYLSGSGTTCLVLEGGDIITVQDDQFSRNGAHIEIMGSIDAGISAARWSPDEELLLVTTKANTAIFMGSSFDPVTEVAMTPDDLKASKHVSVGWGKKETQFQGRGAKALRDPTIPEKVDQGRPSAHEDGSTTISWRGDGAYVAINSVQDCSRRLVRVYSREGDLDSASEPVDGLESALSWTPSGNLMAGIQRLAERIDVIFFERNGLRHGQFTLRSPGSSVLSHEKIRLEWNSDSTVLAVVLKDTIQLWTMGNYHWYLKQEIPIRADFSFLSWHPEKALRFASASSSETAIFEEIFHTARGLCSSPHDNGAVAVIDGETVKLTPFRTANVPPPMSLFDITAESSVVDVAFGPRDMSFAVLHRKGVEIYDWPMKNGRLAKPSPRHKLSFPSPSDGVEPLRICSTSESHFRCLVSSQDSDLAHLSVNAHAGTVGIVDSQEALVSTSTYEDATSVEGYGQDISGNLYKLTDTSTDQIPIRFPTHLPWFELVKFDGDLTAFGLSRNGHLYANSRLLAKNCTSFVLTSSHLIFTTSNHFVKYVHLVPVVEELEVPGDDPETDERCRSVERGSRLVAAIPTNMSIVLQMPRGNVETIFPRAMVVAGIRSLIEEKNYSRAFEYCRTQRVDVNILCDHQPTQFLSNVGLFLDQLKNATYVDLFLSSLREEDVTETMYKDTKRSRTQVGMEDESVPNKPSSKVNAVCDAILKALHARKATNVQNIITAHVCKSPPALDDGLMLVAELMREDEKVAEKAVEHICFLVDVNRVYENALGLYNLDLALLVAQQSQRDPREYLPFIQNLHTLPELRRKFEIDNHLARRSKALSHLHALDTFDEFCTYTTKHSLYQHALQIYRYEPARLQPLTNLYAAHLESKSSYREAGLAYESLRNYAKATSCYRASGASCWQECLYTATQQSPPLSAEAMTDLAASLADVLWEARDYAAAATIHLEYLASPETAIKCLCKGHHFAEAMRLAAQTSRPELLGSAVDVGLAEALGSTTEFLADCKGQLLAQVPRIAELRRKAIEDPLSFYEGERPGGTDIPDDVSVAASSRISTGASLFTRYTGKAGSVGTVGTGVSRATSKNRRREEKKRARGRKGTVYEEEYLVNSVRRLVERVSGTKPEVERLVFALVRRGMAERARAAESLMNEVVGACHAAIPDVFAAPPNNDDQQRQAEDAGELAWRARGGDAVLQEWMEGRAKKQDAPVITGLQKLTLLG
ncbi:elongator complex protein [Metarhizium album ARSEF 1941]|uniref:Elongator complex protein 1 n=1 Tax=Metarhizium album (strain ARSEF 1941) TaxID=1081103 RepID=A0A0B2WW10_METAS|nr:elongator complex protein [Metarhizium album ARSEF 1941]KHN97774.1 elongator complex protein [Metarhizium album ARSEF 1941]